MHDCKTHQITSRRPIAPFHHQLEKNFSCTTLKDPAESLRASKETEHEVSPSAAVIVVGQLQERDDVGGIVSHKFRDGQVAGSGQVVNVLLALLNNEDRQDIAGVLFEEDDSNDSNEFRKRV